MLNINIAQKLLKWMQLFQDKKYNEFIQVFEENKDNFIKADPESLTYYMHVLNSKNYYDKTIRTFESYDLSKMVISAIRAYMEALLVIGNLEGYNKIINTFESINNKEKNQCLTYYIYMH